MILIGQNNDTIAKHWNLTEWDGVMCYISIDTLSGLKTDADFGNGRTNLEELISIYSPKYVNIGIAVDNTKKIMNGDYEDNIIELDKFFKKHNDTQFIAHIAYEKTTQLGIEEFNSVFCKISDVVRSENVKTCIHFIGNVKCDNPYCPPIDENGNLKFDMVGSSKFTDKDTCSMARYIAKQLNIPFVLGEFCLNNVNTLESKEEFDRKLDEINRLFVYDNLHSVSYIADDWKNLEMWKEDKFWNKTDSRINQNFAIKLKESTKHEKKIILGAGGDFYKGFQQTDKLYLDIEKPEVWERRFKDGDIDNLLAEHVWEHLDDDVTATEMCFKYLKEGGVLRLAVPDGYNPDMEYIDFVSPGGSGGGADDHKRLYDIDSLTDLLQNAGFVVTPLEYYDSEGNFHNTDYVEENGKIKRSFKNPNAQKNENKSLIVDAIKPLAS
jgi:predicted SAM-dependent methyltransferase